MKQELTDAELNNDVRQIVLSDLGYDGQLKLRDSKACIIGLDGLEPLIAPKLIGMGIGQLRIVDRDIVSRSDLQEKLVEETCTRDPQRNFIISPKERIDITLGQ